MLDRIVIRKESAADHDQVYEVNHQAFEQDGEARLVEALRRNKNVFVPELSLVAVLDHQIVGHILFTKVKIQEGNHETDSLALAPMAILPEQQNHGVGGKLLQYGLDAAREAGYTSVIVLGHAHYYPRFGFEPAALWNIRAPFDVPSEVFMALELVKGSLTNTGGVVQYAPEFDEI